MPCWVSLHGGALAEKVRSRPGWSSINSPCSCTVAFLRVLSLSSNALWDDEVAALLAAPLPALEELGLGQNRIGEEGAAIVAATAGHQLPNLRFLNLSFNFLGNNGAQALAQNHFPQLERLELQGNATTSVQGAKQLWMQQESGGHS